MTEQTAPTPDDKHAALEAVLQTASFLRANQLSSFLRFICELEIAGRAAEITEYLIGVEALGRPAGYSTAEDSIVRRRAIDLREKLQEIYETEQKAAAVRIELPKGRYVPRFVSVSPSRETAEAEGTAATTAVSSAEAVPAQPPRRGALLPFALGVVVGAALLAAGVTTTRLRVGPERPSGGPILLSRAGEASVEAEASTNTLSGGAAAATCPSCSGGGRVRNIGHNPTNFLVLGAVTVPESGSYLLQVDYVLDGARSFFVSVNDGPPVELSLKGQSWTTPMSTLVVAPLVRGPNRIKLYNDSEFAPDLDRIVVR